MNKEEIVSLIGTQPDWDTKKLLALIEDAEPACEINFLHIGGYELLRDGTTSEVCNSLKEVQSLLEDNGLEYDESITCPYGLADSVSDSWSERYDDGGGSGWIEY